MVLIDDEKNIQITRGDILKLRIKAQNKDGSDYIFQPGDIVRFKVMEKANVANIVIQKDFAVIKEFVSVNVDLTGQDTKIGELINKPVDYWYEVELNPDTNPQTIIGYTKNDKAKIFTLLPEGGLIE